MAHPGPSPASNRWAGSAFLILGVSVAAVVVYLMRIYQLTGSVAWAGSFLAFVNAGGMAAGGAYMLLTGRTLGFGWKDKSLAEKRASLLVLGVGITIAVALELLMMLSSRVVF